MEYYTRRKSHKFPTIILAIISFFVIINILLIIFDRKIMPSVIQISEIMANSQTLDIINEESIKILNDDFNYEQMIKIEKDNDGNIVLIQADTAKLNYISAKLSTQCNEELRKMENSKIKVPLGWMSKSSIFYDLGPKITVDIEPVGNIVTSYESKFESAGINQTRHKIYLNVAAKVRLKLPLKTDDINVTTQIPVSDTIIVGKIPNTTIGFGGESSSNSQMLTNN